MKFEWTHTHRPNTTSYFLFLTRQLLVGQEWSARLRDLYLITHNTHNRQISIPPVGFKPTIPQNELPPKTTP